MRCNFSPVTSYCLLIFSCTGNCNYSFSMKFMQSILNFRYSTFQYSSIEKTENQKYLTQISGIVNSEKKIKEVANNF